MSGTVEAAAQKPAPQRDRNLYLAILLAWILPGAGHGYLRRPFRAAAFFVLVLTTLGIGWHFDGELPWVFSGPAMGRVATLVCLASGAPVLVLRLVLGYQGDPEAVGHDYGSTFLLTAGLMNLLLILDAWLIAAGEKE